MANQFYLNAARQCEHAADQIDSVLNMFDTYSEEFEGYVVPEDLQVLADAYDALMDLSSIIHS